MKCIKQCRTIKTPLVYITAVSLVYKRKVELSHKHNYYLLTSPAPFHTKCLFQVPNEAIVLQLHDYANELSH